MNSPADLAEVLLRKAREDAYVAERLMSDPDSPAWATGFHAQQAVEKALKAVLSRRSIEYPRTHNLAMLVELVRRAGLELPPGCEDLEGLSPFGVVLRYDDFSPGEMVVDPNALRSLLKGVLAWASHLGTGDRVGP